jgi:hypothetical protein
MKLTQIMTYKGKDQSIKLGLREFPDTSRLILICKDENDYLKTTQNLLNKLKDEENDFPENKKRKYQLIVPPDTRDHHELTRFFRGLIEFISNKGEKIAINTTSGIQVWKLALYQAALEHREDIEAFYLIQKSTGERKNIRLYPQLKKYELNMIHIIYQNPDISLTKLQKIYFSKFQKGNLTFISRSVKKLINEKLIEEKKVGRNMLLNLTGDGRSYAPSDDYKKHYEALYNR